MSFARFYDDPNTMRSYSDVLRDYNVVYVPRIRRNKYTATSKKGVNARIPLLRYTYTWREHANYNATYMHELSCIYA